MSSAEAQQPEVSECQSSYVFEAFKKLIEENLCRIECKSDTSRSARRIPTS